MVEFVGLESYFRGFSVVTDSQVYLSESGDKVIQLAIKGLHEPAIYHYSTNTIIYKHSGWYDVLYRQRAIKAFIEIRKEVGISYERILEV